MTTQEIANRYVELCRTGQYETAYKELFADNATAFEPEHSNAPPITQGLDNLLAKSAGFMESVEEMHGGSVSEPLVAGNYFTVSMDMDITFKGAGRMQMGEVCVYKVQDGKIMEERFFF